MKIESLRIGMKVRHPQYGSGLVKSISEAVAEIQFDDGSKHAVAPEPSGLEPMEPQVAVSGLNVPLKQFVESTVESLVARLGIEQPDEVIAELGLRRMVRSKITACKLLNYDQKISAAKYDIC